MSNEQLIGFCNGTINFIRLTNEFSNTELKNSGLFEEEIEKVEILARCSNLIIMVVVGIQQGRFIEEVH